MSIRDVRPSNVAPRGVDPASGVYFKLALFSIALFAAPLTAYYCSVDKFFQGNQTYAGGLAALVANVVLASYVLMAFLEDDGSTAKQRTDVPSGEKKKDK